MRWKSRRALAGVAAGLAVAGGGGAYAATQVGEPDGGGPEPVLPGVAERLGISRPAPSPRSTPRGCASGSSPVSRFVCAPGTGSTARGRVGT
jgi:hypothetical protein